MMWTVLFADGGIFDGALRGALIGGIAGGLAGLLLFIVRLFQKKKPSDSEQTGPPDSPRDKRR